MATTHIATVLLFGTMFPHIVLSKASPIRFENRFQRLSTCDEKGRQHTLEYDVKMATSESFVDLDGDLGSKLSGVTCDIDHTKLTLHFKHRADATEWLVKFHDFTDHFIVGGKAWNCSSEIFRPEYILRRVVAASQSAHLGHDLNVRTAMARYDEVFEDADISYGVLSARASANECRKKSLDTTKHVCLGYNTDCSGSASSEFPLYSNSQISVACSDCWAFLDADVFVNVSIRGFHVEYLSGGFENVHLNTSAVLDMTAVSQWSLGLDKTLQIVPTDYILDFKIGSVPFLLFFDIPLEVKGDFSFNAQAEITAGVAAGIDLGNTYISWDPTHRWQHSTPSFLPSYSATLETSASLDVTTTFGLVPSFELHFDRIFSYTLTANPTLTTEISGTIASGKVCMDSTYSCDLTASADLDININILDFHKDWQWSDTIGSWSKQPIPQACVNITQK